MAEQAQPIALTPEVMARIPLARLCDVATGARFQTIDRYHAYFCGTQDDAKAYDWDGYFTGYGLRAAIEPGWYVPFAQRRPATTVPLAKEIVGRLTSMLFGDQNRPTLHVAGDEDAEAYVRGIAAGARLWAKMVEARDLGGACGGVVLSYGLVAGRPRVEVHNLKHCRALSWRDRAELIPSAVLEAYQYTEEVYDSESERFGERIFWYARYWDEMHEFVWQRMPDEYVRDDRAWFLHSVPDRAVEHGLGECPVVWIQNSPDSYDPDGKSDYDGELDNLDSLNRLQSATTKGTLLNADPTLVVKTSKRPSTVRKGSENSIFSEGGAEYLTLPGDAMRAALEEKAALRDEVLSACQVVIASPEKLSGAAQSAAAIRLMYAPMTARCDVLRTQYGDQGIARVLTGLLRLCKRYEALGFTVELPPREDGAEGEERAHAAGTREHVTLHWPTYFPPTWTEKKEAASAVQVAAGNRTILSRRTAIEAVAQLFGIEDAEAEAEKIDAEAEAALERAADELSMLGPRPSPFDEDEDEDGPVTSKPQTPPPSPKG